MWWDRRKTCIMSVLILICFYLSSRSFSQQVDSTVQRLQLIHAEDGFGEKGRTVLRLVGDVEFRQGDAVLRCDRATWSTGEGRVVLMGNVSISDDVKALFAEKITYYEDNRFAMAENAVTYRDSSKTMYAQRLKYFDEEGKAIAENKVTIIDTTENFELAGELVLYERQSGYARVTVDPVFTTLDSAGQKDIVITGDIMEMYDQGDSIVVSENVRIFKDKVTARCQSLSYNRNEEIIRLTRSPSARQQNNHLIGNQIELILKEREIRAIHIEDDAVVFTEVDSFYRVDPPFDVLSGRDIYVTLWNDRVDSVIVTDQATNFYHVIEDSVNQGINKMLGDRLILVFEDGELAQLDLRSSPGLSNSLFDPSDIEGTVKKELREILTKYNLDWDGK